MPNSECKDAKQLEAREDGNSCKLDDDSEQDVSIWQQLPDGVLYHIFSFLSARDVLHACLTCRQWMRVSYDEFLWMELFYRMLDINRQVPIAPGKTSWYYEFQRLYYHTPVIQSENLQEGPGRHTDQVLHVSFSHNGEYFATSSKDGTIKVWNAGYPATLKYSEDLTKLTWKYTQFSEFNENDTLLLVSGVHFGSHSTSGEIAVFSLQDEFQLQCRVINKPYDIFGCWYDENYLLAGNLYWLGNLSSCSTISINKAFQATESERESVMMTLFRFLNINASSIRTILVATCPNDSKSNSDLGPDDSLARGGSLKRSVSQNSVEQNVWKSQRIQIYEDEQGIQLLEVDQFNADRGRGASILYNEDYRSAESARLSDREDDGEGVARATRENQKKKEEKKARKEDQIVWRIEEQNDHVCQTSDKACSDGSMIGERQYAEGALCRPIAGLKVSNMNSNACAAGSSRAGSAPSANTKTQIDRQNSLGSTSKACTSANLRAGSAGPKIRGGSGKLTSASMAEAGPAVTHISKSTDSFSPCMYAPSTSNSYISHSPSPSPGASSSSGTASAPETPTEAKMKYLIFTTGNSTYTPHLIGIKKIDPERTKMQDTHTLIQPGSMMDQPPDGQDGVNYDGIDHLIDLGGHIIGMCLSPDHRYLYVNSRPWPKNYHIENPLYPPPIAQEIDIHVIDLQTMKEVGTMLRAHKAYTPNDECFFIFLDVCDEYVASGAEDKHGYLWDRHYGICLMKYPHTDVVNSVAFNPKDPEMLVTVSDDNSIKIWRSRNRQRQLTGHDIAGASASNG
ncbi:F-box/WD repeat-containing protein 5 [Lingula anatina]|uniref:F-box/WD repeat-containing protein 5 n=1 Tax=Lingula anatina TaxID=7574 RepID=A0A1S3KD28_LINAN|nr:F-box/WD repeat-containing protein 5 [Lingula anatina]XP_023932151.1 F-box/WD repeat-containing protein 5 [Lingula anatina]|eukprot:XP_013420359.1 F-box/WD repeat-containing protein 5 [Lingula anatina]